MTVRYDAQILSLSLSIFFFFISFFHTLVEKDKNSSWIYVLHCFGWCVSIVFYSLILFFDWGGGHGWSPTVRLLQYISFGSWMTFTLFEKYNFRGNLVGTIKTIQTTLENIWAKFY